MRFFGKTSSMQWRMKEHLRSFPVKIEVVHAIRVSNMHKCERFLLSAYSEKRLQGEWFELTVDDVKWIMSLNAESLEALVFGPEDFDEDDF